MGRRSQNANVHLDHESREKCQRKTSKSRNWKSQNNLSLIKLANQISLPLTLIIFMTPPLILNLKPQRKNSASIQANAFMLLTKSYAGNFDEKYSYTKPNSSSWWGRFIHKSLLFCRCFHDWSFFMKHQSWQTFSEVVLNAANYFSKEFPISTKFKLLL